MSPQFRWLPDEEAWLEDRVITNQGQSDATDRVWVNRLIDDFKIRFPRTARTQKDGQKETEREMLMRWAEIPRVSHSRGTLLLTENMTLSNALVESKEMDQ